VSSWSMVIVRPRRHTLRPRANAKFIGRATTDSSDQGVPEDKRSQDSTPIAVGDVLIANRRATAPASFRRAVASVGADLVAAPDETRQRWPTTARRLLRRSKGGVSLALGETLAARRGCFTNLRRARSSPRLRLAQGGASQVSCDAPLGSRFPYLGLLSGTSPESCAASALRCPGASISVDAVGNQQRGRDVDRRCVLRDRGRGLGSCREPPAPCCWLALSLPTFDPTPPVEPVAFTLVAPRGALSAGATLWPHLQSHARRCGEPPAGGFRPSRSHGRSYGTPGTTRPRS
jgi:hypothetical protein